MNQRTPHIQYLGVACFLLLSVGSWQFVRADAIVLTQAMKASTIAEVFVDPDGVRVELEISQADLEVFRDLLPEQLDEVGRADSEPASQRHERFLREGLVIFDQKDARLAATVQSTTVRRRVVRDEVTGDPLSVQPKDAPLVLHVVLQYGFDQRPTSLKIRPPLRTETKRAAANIGFVCYHNGLLVSDFRYLPGEVIVDLDWNDPWYSRFRNRNLRRQFDAPLLTFLYVEPFEVRKEIIIRPKDLAHWMELDLPQDGILRAAQQQELKQQVAAFLGKLNPVEIDGTSVEGRLDRIHFIRRTLRTTGVIEPPVDLDLNSAVLGVIFVYSIDHLPKQVTMKWEMFSPRIQKVPATASDEAGGLPSELSPDDPLLTWTNYLTNPTIPKMMSVTPPTMRRLSLPIVSTVCFIVAMLVALLAWRRSGQNWTTALLVGVAIMIVGVLALPYARASVPAPWQGSPELTPEEAPGVMNALIHNVYRAFDRRDERLVYDRLAMSISGELLSDIYLQMRKSIELENQGGAQVKVDEVVLEEIVPEEASDTKTLSYLCRWNVSGSVGHWGHIHQRRNHYEALVTIKPTDDSWKITQIQLRDERRGD